MFDQIHNFHIRIDEMEHLIREGKDKARKEHVQRLEDEELSLVHPCLPDAPINNWEFKDLPLVYTTKEM